MARIYISSTYSDLKEHREKVYQTLRRMQHDAVAMEDYVATGQHPPLDKCLADVAKSDLYVGIFAWRYGYIPSEGNPQQKSITELEYRQAEETGKPCLIFWLHEDALWLPKFMDKVTGDGESGKRIEELRQELSTAKLVSFFKTPDELANLVAVAVQQWEQERVDEQSKEKLSETLSPATEQTKYDLRDAKSYPVFPKKSIFLQFFLPRQWQEVGFLGLLLFLSLLPPLQDLLLESRLFVQAGYRQATGQIPSQVESPLLLVQIDNNSLNKDNVKLRYPIDYSYLDSLVEKALNLKVEVVGIDYVLDRDKEQNENSQKLAKTIRQAQENQPETRLVFAAINSEDSRKGSVSKDLVTIDSEQYQKGDIDFFQWYVELPDYSDDSTLKPFAYLLALNYSCLVDQSSDLNRVKLKAKSSNNCSSISNNDELFHFVSSLKILSVSQFIQWFHPIIDFSIPPDKAYQRLSACEFLETCATQHLIPKSLQSKLVLIAAGGYEEAGLKKEGEDNYHTPLAVNFWRGWSNKKFPGGEAHAYMIHHFLTRRLVVPIPDFLMVMLAALLGKGVLLILLNNPRQPKQWLMWLGGATAVYILVGLQIYISAALLIPLLLPSAVFWNYVRLSLRRKSHG